MLNYNKQYDIRRVLERIVTEDDLISAVFQDIPELQEFTWSVTSEYDDNNYSTYTNLTSINGHHVDYDADYEHEDEDGEPVVSDSKLPRMSKEKRSKVLDVVQSVGEKWGYGEDHTAIRDDFVPKARRRNHAKADPEEIEYVRSYMNSTPLSDEYFRNLEDAKWAVYYADDHGRFSPELEYEIFAKEGRMWEAFCYSQAIKAPLCEQVENFFLLNNGEEDKKYLQMYLESKATKVAV